MTTEPRQRYRRLTLWSAACTLLVLGLAMAMPPLSGFAVLGTSMLTVHLLMELFAITIAVLVVVVSWSTFEARDPYAPNVLISGFAVVALCDTAHALTYAGMPDFLLPASTSRAIFFWLMGRSAEVFTLLLVATGWAPRLARSVWLACSAALIGLLLWLGSWGIDLFPQTFVAGRGVTEFKAFYEYALAGAYLVVAGLFWRKARHSDQLRDHLLTLSAFVMGAGEIMFTAYVAPSDFQNIFGHSFKIASYSLLFWTTFVSRIRAPFDELQRSERRLMESEQRIRSLSDNLPNSMVYRVAMQADGSRRFVHVSAGVTQLYGISVEQAKRDATLIYGQLDEADRFRLDEATRASLKSRTPIEIDVRVQRADGSQRWIQIHSAPHANEQGEVVWDGVHADVTQRHSAEDEIARLGFYDDLTGLPNRRLFVDRLGLALTSSLRSGKFGALFLLDLDNFKDFNDTLGHDLGDELLREMATRLSALVRSGDTVARFGGDEFVIILDELSANASQAANDAHATADKILASLREPVQLGGRPSFITISVGINLFGDGATSVDEMMKRADLAMYRAKAAGRNTVKFFDQQMQTAVSERIVLEADLRKALDHGEFVLHYQPQVIDGRIAGVESLVRWNHPEKGLISPALFIPVAEACGLIVPLGRWIMETACRQIAQWRDNPLAQHLSVSVNVSVREFHAPQFVESVVASMARFGVDPRRLKIELTESLLAEDMDTLIGMMTELRGRGVEFALDDFGTGYSSLSYLKRFPLSVLKIDQSFVRDILTDPHDAAIARTIIALGQSLGLEVIAEGVEVEGQRAFLAEQGCRAYQGYLFHRPMPALALEQVLRNAA